MRTPHPHPPKNEGSKESAGSMQHPPVRKWTGALGHESPLAEQHAALPSQNSWLSFDSVVCD